MNSRENKRKYDKLYYQLNKESIIESGKKYYQENKEKILDGYNTKFGKTKAYKYKFKHNLKKNKSLDSKMDNLFKYQCIKNADSTDNFYWVFENNTIKWLVDFKTNIKHTIKPNKKEYKSVLGVLDTDDMLTMKLRMKECKSKEELYDKYYQQYTTESFLKILKLTIEDIKKDRK